MRRPLTLIIAAAAGSVTLWAGAYQHDEAGVSMWFPDNWNVNIAEEGLSASSVDNDAQVEAISLAGAADLASATTRSGAALAARVRQFRETEARRDVTLDGMKGFAFAGEGMRRGLKKAVRVTVFRAPRQWVVLIWTVDYTKTHQYRAIQDRITDSIRAVRNRG